MGSGSCLHSVKKISEQYLKVFSSNGIFLRRKTKHQIIVGTLKKMLYWAEKSYTLTTFTIGGYTFVLYQAVILFRFTPCRPMCIVVSSLLRKCMRYFQTRDQGNNVHMNV